MNKYTSFANEAVDSLARDIKMAGIAPHYVNFSKDFSQQINAAVKFKLPDNGQLFETNELDPTETLRKFIDMRLNLPFPLIAIEFVELMEGISPDLKVLVVAEEKGDEILARVGLCNINETHGWHFCDCFVTSIHRDTYEVGCYFVQDEHELADLDGFKRKASLSALIATRVLSQVLCALSCNNTEITDDLVKPSPLKQSMRKNKGKIPFYSFKVLTVKTQAAKKKAKRTTTAANGTPKRNHLRRGHIRVYEDRNLKTWVNKCIVGDMNIGSVDKEYMLTA